MNKLGCAKTIGWNDLPDIENAEAFDQDDEACFAEIRSVLEKYKKQSKFGVTLLHKHFDISEGECLVEYTDVENRLLFTRVEQEDILARDENRTIVETTWRFDKPIVNLCNKVCTRRCSRSISGWRAQRCFAQLLS